MAKKAPTLKAKEPVKIRAKKLANGSQSLFLDILDNGQRTKEYLKLYLIPEREQADKIANANTLQAATAIKAQRIKDIVNGKAGISKTESRITLFAWIKIFEEMPHGRFPAKDENSITKHIRSLAHHLKEMGTPDTKELRQIDKKFCVSFAHYLQHDAICFTRYGEKSKKNKHISPQTAFNYFDLFAQAMQCAENKGVILRNPVKTMDKRERPQKPAPHRDYLTLEELQILLKTPILHDGVKRAFLFSCLCGLRLSDTMAIKWENIKETDTGKVADIIVKKTQKPLFVPLNEDAINLATTSPDTPQAKLFELPSQGYIQQVMRDWCKNSGINKNITFHTSRHTFATLQLTMGTDLYTICKMLGHSNIGTTQIYADIIGQKKVEAANRLQGLVTIN